MSKTVEVAKEWTIGESGTPLLSVHVAGINGGSFLMTFDGTGETSEWFGLTVDEVRDLYFGFGIMLGEYDEDEQCQSKGA